MKTCSNCNQDKPVAEFGTRRASFDGLTAACLECLRARDRARYPKERERRSSLYAAYIKTPEGKAIAERAKQKWRENNQLKRAAHIIVGNAIKSGRLVPWPCEVCGKKAQAHHPSYEYPLVVVWLCPLHHKAAHAQTPRDQG